MRVLQRALFIVAVLLLIAGCRKAVDWEEFDLDSITGSLEALEEAEQRYIDRLESEGLSSAARSAVEYFESQECSDTAGIAPDSSVWVFFRNGLLGTILVSSFDTTGASACARPEPPLATVSAGGEVTPEAVLLSPFGAELVFGVEFEVAELVDTCLGGSGGATQMKQYYMSQVSVEKVKEVLLIGPGVLYWTGHGELIPPERGAQPCCGLLTGKSYSTRDMAEKLAGEYSGQVGPGGRELAVTRHGGKYYLTVMPAFVEKHANFDHLEGMGHNQCKGLVYICCCFSACQGNPALEQAFLAAGADVYCGYDWAVTVGFSSEKDLAFYQAATDTCTVGQAFAGAGNRTDPKTLKGRNATYRMSGDTLLMVRAQMRMKRNGESFRGYSVGVTVHDVTSVSCFAGNNLGNGITVNFPGSGPGSWDCVAQDDAEIVWTDILAGKAYFVGKDLVGVSGTIEVPRYEADVISGTFSGTLGYWSTGRSPEEEPPDETISITDGIFKHTGVRQ